MLLYEVHVCLFNMNLTQYFEHIIIGFSLLIGVFYQ